MHSDPYLGGQPHEKAPAQFVCFRVEPLTGEPTIYRTMGRGRPIYAECLEAAPASWAAPADYQRRQSLPTADRGENDRRPPRKGNRGLGQLQGQGRHHVPSKSRVRPMQARPPPTRSTGSRSLHPKEKGRVWDVPTGPRQMHQGGLTTPH